MSDRLLMIESFVEEPPMDEFQWGYLFALMEESVDDIVDAGNPIFNAALEMFKDKYPHMYRIWSIRRNKTLS